MDGKNKLIQRILADAEAKCSEIINNATTQSAQLVDNAKSKIALDQEALVLRSEGDYQAIIDNQMSNAKLSVSRYRLSCKQSMIDQVYDKAKSELQSLTPKQYLALVTSLLRRYAEQGELVTISAKDAKVITQEYLAQFDKGLTLNTHYADIDGGVILSTDNYDKVLTLTSVVDDVRRSSEGAVAKILFEGE